MKLHTLWALPLLGVLAFPASAHDRHFDGPSRLERRIENQHWRIDAGVQSGELTHREARKLRRQNRRIARLARRFLRDGHFDREERHALRDRLRAASERIERFKHNDRYRNRRGHGRRHGNRQHFRDNTHDRVSFQSRRYTKLGERLRA